MKEYNLILASNKFPKLDCTYCNAKKHWQRYYNIETGEPLPPEYGKCDNVIKCGLELNPYKDGFAQRIYEQEKGSGAYFQRIKSTPYVPQPKPEVKEPAYIPYEILKATRKGYEQNTFISNLLNRVQFPFDVVDVEQVIKLYHLGTICKGYRAGAITFPFIDSKGNVRTIQAKQFDATNHTLSTDFLHSIYEKDCKRNNKPLPEWLELYLKNETVVSCLYGEHLLSKYQTNPVILVEAPKTAILGTLYFGLPDNPKNFLWLAVYNLSSLTIEKCKILQGRKVVLIPDLNAYENWSNKAKQFQDQIPGTTFKVSDLIQNFAPNESKNKGEDIADFLCRMDWRKFKKEQPAPDAGGQIPELKLEDIFLIPTEHHTGKEFDNLIIAWIKTKEGKNYELLFNKDEHPLPFGEKTETVKKLGQFFNKLFKPIQFENGVYYSNTFFLN